MSLKKHNKIQHFKFIADWMYFQVIFSQSKINIAQSPMTKIFAI